MKKLAALCALAALPVASAQTHVTLSQQSPPLRQPVQLVLEVYNPGKTPARLGRIRKDFVTCPPFKLYAKAGGPPRIERYYAADCDTGETVTIAPGQRRRFRVQLPWRDLVPGAYTAFLEIPVDGRGRSLRVHAFYRSLEAYRNSMGDGRTVMVLDPDSEFLRYFGGESR